MTFRPLAGPYVCGPDNAGTVVRTAEDTPYGRLAAATDPTGVVFNLSSLPD